MRQLQVYRRHARRRVSGRGSRNKYNKEATAKLKAEYISKFNVKQMDRYLELPGMELGGAAMELWNT